MEVFVVIVWAIGVFIALAGGFGVFEFLNLAVMVKVEVFDDGCELVLDAEIFAAEVGMQERVDWLQVLFCVGSWSGCDDNKVSVCIVLLCEEFDYRGIKCRVDSKVAEGLVFV